MITLEEAKNRILSTVKRYSEEFVPVCEARNRICSRKIIAPRDLPLFDTADIDGFAVMTSDVLMATEEDPTTLRLVAIIKPGESYEGELNPGECAQVFAGSRIPKAADAIVPLEFAEPDPQQSTLIRVTCSSRPWENIRKRGEDLMYGALIATQGDKLTTAQITLLSAFGIKDVPVVKQPKVCVISIGGELRSPGEDIKAGEIYESNSILISSMIRKHISESIERMIILDDEDTIYKTVESALKIYDVVITTGRISEGQIDVVSKALKNKSDLRVENWRIMIKPGRPFAFGIFQNRNYFFGLPGNPVSAAVSYSLLVRPAILKMLGCHHIDLPVEEGELVEEIQNPGNRRHFVRVKIDDRKRVKPVGMQTSYGLSSLLNSNGIVDVPPHTILQKGTLVKVLKWEVAD